MISKPDAGRYLLSGAATLLLSACMTLGPDYRTPHVPEIAPWQMTLPQERSAGQDYQRWWAQLHDPILTTLVEQAMQQNPDVRVAGLRLLESRAQLGIAESLLGPQATIGSGEWLRSGQQRNGSYQSGRRYSASFNLGWELDFWGKFQRGIESADANYFATLAQYDDVQVLLAAQVAQLYVTIRTLEARLQIAGCSTAAIMPNWMCSKPTPNTSPPSPASPSWRPACGRARTPWVFCWPGYPVHCRRWPPIAASFHRESWRWSPSFPQICCGGVPMCARPSDNWNLSWVAGPTFSWNLLDQGRLGNQVLVQDARFLQLHEQYRKRVFQAARDVDDAAIAYANGKDEIRLLTATGAAAERSLAIANTQYREGMADFQRVLDSQRALFNQQERLVNSRGDQMRALITLYKALGGGWEQGRQRPLVSPEVDARLRTRDGWSPLLNMPLPAATAPNKVDNHE